MNGNGIYILSMGMMCSVGLNAMQTFASVRSGITKSCETSIYDKYFNPFVMSLLPEDVLPPLEQAIENEAGLTSKQRRMLRLATFPLQDALQSIPNAQEIPLFLGVPEQIPGRPKPVSDNFIELLGRQTKKALNEEKSQLFVEGRAAGLTAIKAAIEAIESGEAQYVLVGGVDTYLDLYLLGSLDSENRILSQRTMDGFIPGEGAGFLLLGKSNRVGDIEVAPYARILSASMGFEKGHLYSEEVYKGNGLSETFTELFRNGDTGRKIGTVYAGLNGESFSSKEWGVAYLRLKERFEENYRFEHPADCIGDAGAALGLLMTGLASIGLAKKTIAGPCAVWCSSDYGRRAAIIVDSV